MAITVDAMSSMYTCDHPSMDLFSLALSCSPAPLPDGGMDCWGLGARAVPCAVLCCIGDLASLSFRLSQPKLAVVRISRLLGAGLLDWGPPSSGPASMSLLVSLPVLE